MLICQNLAMQDHRNEAFRSRSALLDSKSCASHAGLPEAVAVDPLFHAQQANGKSK
jgi:hypothetical protein